MKTIKTRLPKWKAQLEVLIQALTVIEKLRTLLSPVLMLLLSKDTRKILFTVIGMVIKFSLLFLEP